MDTSDSDGGSTVLIVEDAEEIRKMVCVMLTQSGYTVLEAADGTEALRLLETRDGAIDLVITDMLMPEMNGPELARRLAQSHPQVPVVFMSGFTEDPIVRRVEHQSPLFLGKPFTATALVEKVRQALERPYRQNSTAHSSGRSQ